MGDYFLTRDRFLETYHPAHGTRAEYYKKKLGHPLHVPDNLKVIGWTKDKSGRTFVKLNNDDNAKESAEEFESGTRSSFHGNSKGMSIDVAFQKLLAEKRLEGFIENNI
jgi:hypothetical protein